MENLRIKNLEMREENNDEYTPGFQVHSLNKTYGDKRVLKDVSFTIPKGKIFGFVGANGAGKTTTMRIMLGITAANSGKALMNGKVIDDSVRAKIGYMPEERGLYPRMRIGEQLEYLARLHGLKQSEACEQVKHWTKLLGIDTRFKDTVEKLSLGNQQRVQLAAALVHSPKALILDEPFSGLDPVAVEVMSEVLRKEAERGVTTIFSSHQLELVEKNCDLIGIISEGSMVVVGTVQELRDFAYKPHFELRGSSQAIQSARAKAKEFGLTEETEELISEKDNKESTTVLRLPGQTESDTSIQILRAAVETGTVSYFAAVEPPLSELFKTVIHKEDTSENTAV